MLAKEYTRISIILLGDSGVGKSELFHTFMGEQSDYKATIGVDFRVKDMVYKNHQIKLIIWDTAGQEQFRAITRSYYKHADGVMLMFALNCSNSFDNLKSWIGDIETNANEDIPKLIVGTKSDLHMPEPNETETYMKYAKTVDSTFIATSSEYKYNIDVAFIKLIKMITDQPGLHMSSKNFVTPQITNKSCSC